MVARHVVSISFSILYALCFIFVAFNLYAMQRNKSKMLGFLAFFNYFTLAWAFCRTFYWSAFAQDAPLVVEDTIFSFLLFLLPLCFQYCTFALLGVFLTKLMVDTATWREGAGARVWALCIGGGVYSALGTLIVSVLAGVLGPAWARPWQLGNALLFLLLGGAFLWLALLVRQRPDAEYARMLLKKTSLSNVTAAVTMVFATRCLYDLLAFAGAISLDLNKDDFVTDASAAVLYGVWEFFPLILLLSTLAAGPDSGVSMPGGSLLSGKGGAQRAQVPTFGVFGAILAMEEKEAAGEAGASGGSGEGGGGGGVGTAAAAAAAAAASAAGKEGSGGETGVGGAGAGLFPWSSGSSGGGNGLEDSLLQHQYHQQQQQQHQHQHQHQQQEGGLDDSSISSISPVLTSFSLQRQQPFSSHFNLQQHASAYATTPPLTALHHPHLPPQASPQLRSGGSTSSSSTSAWGFARNSSSAALSLEGNGDAAAAAAAAAARSGSSAHLGGVGGSGRQVSYLSLAGLGGGSGGGSGNFPGNLPSGASSGGLASFGNNSSSSSSSSTSNNSSSSGRITMGAGLHSGLPVLEMSFGGSAGSASGVNVFGVGGTGGGQGQGWMALNPAALAAVEDDE